MQTILFLTTANLVTNPRSLKEILVAKELGYKTIVVAFHLGGWSVELEKKLFEYISDFEIYYLDATKSDGFDWLAASIIHQLFSFFPFLTKKNIAWESFLIDKRSFQLTCFLNKNKFDAQIVIAHNPGSFYAAAKYAKTNNSKLLIDIEDYHPGEYKNPKQRNRMEKYLISILPFANHITCASPMIKKKVVELIGDTIKNKTTTINNNFPRSEFVLPKELNGKIKLVWFSQNIDYGRGLEIILPVLDCYSDEIELTLIGNLRLGFKQNEIISRNYIKFIKALPQIELHQKLSCYDIGLAIEDVESDENRSICLTNKIWAYLQSGLYIIAINTKAQSDFIKRFSFHGILVNKEESDIKACLEKIICEIETIRSQKNKRFLLAKANSWDNEQVKFINIIDQ